MQKKTKLRVKAETLRSLSGVEIAWAVGGARPPSGSCNAACFSDPRTECLCTMP